MTDWLTIKHGDEPIVVSVPHAGLTIPEDLISGYRSLPIARHDADLYVDQLYVFAADLGATIVSTDISRSVIDVNRDPSGASLYPGQITTGLCPVTSFDGAPLYLEGREPDDTEIKHLREAYFEPYHSAITNELKRLREMHGTIVLYDAHSILSHVERLFDGELPQFNIGTNDGKSCAPELTARVEKCCADSGHSHVTNGRFKGGWITRHYGSPGQGIHAIQMELAMRGYLDETANWPPPWDSRRAASLQQTLSPIISQCIDFAKEQS